MRSNRIIHLSIAAAVLSAFVASIAVGQQFGPPGGSGSSSGGGGAAVLDTTLTVQRGGRILFVGSNGSSISVIQGVAGGMPPISDTGTRPNVADIDGTATQFGGGTWQLFSQNGNNGHGFAVSSNAFVSNGGGNNSGSMVNTSFGDGFVQVTLVNGVGAAGFGPVFRVDAAGANGYGLMLFSDGAVYLRKITAGTESNVQNAFCHAVPFPDVVLRADYSGTTIKVSCNGSPLFTSTGNTFQQGGTYAGMYSANGTGPASDSMVNWSTGAVAPASQSWTQAGTNTNLTLNFKVVALATGATLSGTEVVNAAAAPLTYTATVTGASLGCRTASGSQSGCLSSADWTTFNGKQAAGSYLTVGTTTVVYSAYDSTALAAGTTELSRVTNPSASTATLTPFACTEEILVPGSGAGTCTVSLLDATASATLCTISYTCNTGTGPVNSSGCSGTVGFGHTMTISETVPAANTSAIGNIACSLSQ